MKIVALSVVAVMALGLAGCSEKTEPGGQEVSAPAERSGDGSVESGGEGTGSTLTGAAQQVERAVGDAAAKVQGAAVESAAKAQALLEQAKGLLDEKRLQEAGGVLEELSAMSLDEGQRETLVSLTQEAQKLYGEVEEGLGELKTLVEQEKYAEATTLVSKLGEYELSPEQQQLLEELKGEVQKLLETEAGQNASKALGELLGR